MRAARVVAVLLIVTGTIWVLQGGGWLGGSSMSGQRLWLWIGLGCAAAGLALLGAARRSD